MISDHTIQRTLKHNNNTTQILKQKLAILRHLLAKAEERKVMDEIQGKGSKKISIDEKDFYYHNKDGQYKTTYPTHEFHYPRLKLIKNKLSDLSDFIKKIEKFESTILTLEPENNIEELIIEEIIQCRKALLREHIKEELQKINVEKLQEISASPLHLNQKIHYFVLKEVIRYLIGGGCSSDFVDSDMMQQEKKLLLIWYPFEKNKRTQLAYVKDITQVNVPALFLEEIRKKLQYYYQNKLKLHHIKPFIIEEKIIELIQTEMREYQKTNGYKIANNNDYDGVKILSDYANKAIAKMARIPTLITNPEQAQPDDHDVMELIASTRQSLLDVTFQLQKREQEKALSSPRVSASKQNAPQQKKQSMFFYFLDWLFSCFGRRRKKTVVRQVIEAQPVSPLPIMNVSAPSSPIPIEGAGGNQVDYVAQAQQSPLQQNSFLRSGQNNHTPPIPSKLVQGPRPGQ